MPRLSRRSRVKSKGRKVPRSSRPKRKAPARRRGLKMAAPARLPPARGFAVSMVPAVAGSRSVERLVLQDLATLDVKRSAPSSHAVITPSLFTGRLAGIKNYFQQMRLLSVSVEYDSTIGTGVAGTLWVWWDFESTAVPASYSQVLNQDSRTRLDLWRPQSVRGVRLPAVYRNAPVPTSSENFRGDGCQFAIGYFLDGVPAPFEDIGHINIHITVELMQRQLPAAAPVGAPALPLAAAQPASQWESDPSPPETLGAGVPRSLPVGPALAAARLRPRDPSVGRAQGTAEGQ